MNLLVDLINVISIDLVNLDLYYKINLILKKFNCEKPIDLPTTLLFVMVTLVMW